MEVGELTPQRDSPTIACEAGAVDTADNMDLLLDAVNDYIPGPEEAGLNATEAGRFLISCLTDTQATNMQRMMRQGSDSSPSDIRMWGKVKRSIIRHPAVIGHLAELSKDDSSKDSSDRRFHVGLKQYIAEMDEPEWKKKASCTGDTRFVNTTFRSLDVKKETMSICADCPVHQQCLDYVTENRPEAGVWAGVSRSADKGKAYHKDGSPRTMDEELETMGISRSELNEQPK